ncbi:hypothetical protein [Marinicrinis lubricantis]|uniref:WYL domain-containing protein n=1 Tax=Marinicrinis lubricantis TaxID=2086470 RepID=A0ABW1INB8_9BACL
MEWKERNTRQHAAHMIWKMYKRDDGSGYLWRVIFKKRYSVLECFLLGIGHSATVVKPPELIHCMKHNASEILSKYKQTSQ